MLQLSVMCYKYLARYIQFEYGICRLNEGGSNSGVHPSSQQQEEGHGPLICFPVAFATNYSKKGSNENQKKSRSRPAKARLQMTCMGRDGGVLVPPIIFVDIDTQNCSSTCNLLPYILLSRYLPTYCFPRHGRRQQHKHKDTKDAGHASKTQVPCLSITTNPSIPE
jgi:hypothetical protein